MKIIPYPYPKARDEKADAWSKLLLTTEKKRVLLKWIRFESFVEGYQFDKRGQDLFSNLVDYFLLQQELIKHIPGRPAAINLQMNASIRSLDEINDDLAKKSEMIKRCRVLANDDYPIPTVLLANVLGCFFIVERYIQKNGLEELTYETKQDVLTVMFEPGYQFNSSQPEDFFSQNTHVVNPMFQPDKYGARADWIMKLLDRYQVDFNKVRSNYRYREASLLHMLISDPKFLEDQNDTVLPWLIDHCDINLPARDRDNLYTTAIGSIFQKNRHLDGVRPIVEALRVSNSRALNLLTANSELELNFSMQHRPFQELNLSGVYSTEEYFRLGVNEESYPEQLPNGPGRYVTVGYMKDDVGYVKDNVRSMHFRLAMEEYRQYIFADFLMRQGNLDYLTEFLKRGMPALNIKDFVEENDRHNDRFDFDKRCFRISEIAYHLNNSNGFMPLLYSPEMSLVADDSQLKAEFIKRLNIAESKYLLGSNFSNLSALKGISAKNNQPIILDGIPAINVIQAEIEANKKTGFEVRKLLRTFFQINEKGCSTIDQSRIDIESQLYSLYRLKDKTKREPLKKRMKMLHTNQYYKIGKTLIHCKNQPRIGQFGNCEVMEVGTYENIMSKLNPIIAGDPEKEKAIACYFLALAKGEKYDDAAKYLQCKNIHSCDDHDTLNRIYYLVVIREVSRRYNTGLTPFRKLPKRYPFCIAQYCAIDMVAKGRLKWQQVLGQDAEYGLPTGAKVCGDKGSAIDQATEKVVKILKYFVLDKMPEGLRSVFNARSMKGQFLSLSERCLKSMLETSFSQPIIRVVHQNPTRPVALIPRVQLTSALPRSYRDALQRKGDLQRGVVVKA
jgi:hypothetical protein